MYDLLDAEKALRQFLLESGYEEPEIGRFCHSLIEEVDNYRYLHWNDEDEIEFNIRFIDDIGTAKVTFHDGTFGVVSIRD